MQQVTETQSFTQGLGIIETPTFLLRDNKTAHITVYVGTEGTKLPDGKTDLPGINDLLTHLPWHKQAIISLTGAEGG